MPDASTGRPVLERVPPEELDAVARPAPMLTADDHALSSLQARCPWADIWKVHPVVGPVSWSARRKGQPAAEVSTTDGETLLSWLEGHGATDDD
jgi:hypothetical protein